MPDLSIVMPAHNSGIRLAQAIEQLGAQLQGLSAEVIIVENGSQDDTWEISQNLADRQHQFPVIACQSPTGLGAAYHEGIRRASGETVLLTADDLPFGLTDIDGWLQLGDPTALVIGSKAHPDSAVSRSLLRAAMSGTYRALRLLILGMRVADCQGTIFAPRTWLADRLPALRESGYLASTEIVFLAQCQGVRIVEIPVKLIDRHAGTRIQVGDVRDMGLGLLRLRRRRHGLRVAGR